MRPLTPTETLPTSRNPVNVIYSGVAGTGKTYRLLQIAKQYSDCLPTIDQQTWMTQLVSELSWREVVCLILLDKKAEQKELVKVPEIVAHEFFVIKAAQNERLKNLNNTVWSVLQTHSPVSSQTVSCDKRASQAYFDKDESGAWYLLADSVTLLEDLQHQLTEYHQAKQAQASGTQPMRNERFSMVSFHQAYGYEEFVEGIRPVLGAHSSGQVSYEVQDGAFLQLCQRATQDPEQRYAMLIDEINRANVSRVFGELLSLIEPDKRIGLPNAMSVTLAYSGRSFSVPANVDIYATMNTQDHSLAPLDMALRRRFRFIDCPPQPELLATIRVDEDVVDLGQLLAGLNQRITQTLGQEAQLGHAFLLTVNDLTQLQAALVEQIIPQLAQATGGQLKVLQFLFRDEDQPLAAQFIRDAQMSSQHTAHEDAGAHNDIAAYPNVLASNSIFGSSTLSTSGYVINADLLTGAGKFAQAAAYQRLY
ncbi:McrB family protein [Psychrobacter sp. 1U2]|uniref:McrB family protein n=1 Tax=Psychrobacter sp. 1U2 TaxID=3453577 RepID=UPI003F4470C2